MTRNTEEELHSDKFQHTITSFYTFQLCSIQNFVSKLLKKHVKYVVCGQRTVVELFLARSFTILSDKKVMKLNLVWVYLFLQM